MTSNILVGGAAGQGIETVSAIFEKILKRQGFEVFTTRDYMSRVRGGHNFIQVRFGDGKIYSHSDKLDGIIAMNDEAIENHIGRLDDNGFVICDEEIGYDDDRLLKLPLMQAAKASGNIKTIGSVAIGSVLELLGIGDSGIDKELTEAGRKVTENVFSEFFIGEVADLNIKAFRSGRKLVSQMPGTGLKSYKALKTYMVLKSDMEPAAKECSILINGNEALALGALAAGCKFYSAYPMTPSTSIMDYLASKMHDSGVVVEQAEDEIAAINMAIGASYAGTRAMTGTSGGGFSLMVEGLGLSGMLEVPLVIAEVQRPGPTTGFPTRTEQSDLKFVISASQGEFPRMVIALRNAEDAFYQTVRAFNIADGYQLPVIILSDQFLADTTVTIEPFDFDSIRRDTCISNWEYSADKPYRRYEITPSGISPRLVPGRDPGVTVLVDSDEHDESGYITESAEVRSRMAAKRLRKLELLREELQEPLFMGEEDCEVLLLAWGSTWGPIKEAVNKLNNDGDIKYGALIFGDIWPLPTKSLFEKAGKAKRIINVEQNATGQLASIVTEVTGIFCNSSILKFDGRPMNSEYIYNEVRLKEQSYVRHEL